MRKTVRASELSEAWARVQTVDERSTHRARIDGLLDKLAEVQGKLNETLIRAEMAEERADHAELELMVLRESK